MLQLIGRHGVQVLAEMLGPEVYRLARIYRRAGVVPPWSYADSEHLAWATVAGADVLASWNRRQLVRLKTRRQSARINFALGFESVDIRTPPEVLSEAREG